MTKKRKPHNKSLDHFSFEAVKAFQSQYKNPIMENGQTFLQQSASLNDTDTDNDDPIKKRIPQMMINFPLIYHCLIIHLPLEILMTLKMKIYHCKLSMKQIHLLLNSC